MQAICKECGAIYTVDGELPCEFSCFCKSEQFKIIKGKELTVEEVA